MAEERGSNRNSTAVKLLITSTDCDPEAELSFSDGTPATWNAIVDALSRAKYCLAMHRLTLPSNPAAATKSRKTGNPRTKAAFLSLHASKKAAFLYSDGGDDDEAVKTKYHITYDQKFLNDLPSFHNLKGLPRFHLFTSLPDDLQLSVVKLLDAGRFSRLRCVNRRYSRLRWKDSFNIQQYSHPKSENKSEKPKKKDESFHENAFIPRFVSAICIVAMVCGIFNIFTPGAGVDEEYE